LLGRFPESDEYFIPESIEPSAQSLDPLRIHGIKTARALGAGLHQARRSKHPEVLGDRRSTHLQAVGELSHRACAAAQTFEYRPSGSIAERI
jgi:hypothetical protein